MQETSANYVGDGAVYFGIVNISSPRLSYRPLYRGAIYALGAGSQLPDPLGGSGQLPPSA